jgi:hypothetical protein
VMNSVSSGLKEIFRMVKTDNYFNRLMAAAVWRLRYRKQLP